VSSDDGRRRPRVNVSLARDVYAELVAFAESTAERNVSLVVQLALIEFLRSRGRTIELAPSARS
jgi:hypothetical protein